MIENKRTIYTAATILIQMPHSCHYHPANYNLPINVKHFPWHSGEKDSLLEEEDRWDPLTNLFCWNILKSTPPPSPMFYKNTFYFSLKFDMFLFLKTIHFALDMGVVS